MFESSQFTCMDVTQRKQRHEHCSNRVCNYEFTGCMATQTEAQAHISAKWSPGPSCAIESSSRTLDNTQMRKPEHKTTSSQLNNNRLQASVCQIGLELLHTALKEHKLWVPDEALWAF